MRLCRETTAVSKIDCKLIMLALVGGLCDGFNSDL